MKEIIQQYAMYNVWANTQMVQLMLTLTEGQVKTSAPSSFQSLYATLVHMYETEVGWFKRIELDDQMQVFGNTPDMPIADLGKKLLQQSERYQSWVTKVRVEKLEHVIAYRNTKKEEFKQPVYQILMHLFNHQTYHRGQLVTILHQLGVGNIPNTDFITFTRKVYKAPKKYEV